mmetsp:Transcript_22629/g.45997  ORF Transcript_22629/g.45997 Transcript_22629/m.45997 type:complete len:275 (+) Transcript_22629:144-968(+)
MKTSYTSLLCTSLHLLTGSSAFTTSLPSLSTKNAVSPNQRTQISVSLADETSSATGSTANSNNANSSNTVLDSKQHLYGRDLVDITTGDLSYTLPADDSSPDADASSALPLPSTYITCGKCKSLFAISSADLGAHGKGRRVKCSVCDNSWYQSRDRLLDIPTQTHELLPLPKSDLERIAKNLEREESADFAGVFKLYVGNLDWNVKEEDLKEFFESGVEGGGEVCDVSIVRGEGGRSRGFAFVTFYEEEVGRKALELNGKECNGREISVREPNN